MAANLHSINEFDASTATPDIVALEQILKASSDALRLRILQVLQHDAYGVLELCSLFAVKQSAMSHHLKVLANAELVSTRREGNTIFYRRAIPAACQNSDLLNQLFVTLDAIPHEDELRSAMESAQEERVKRSQQFFAENAERFNAQQELITHFDDYRDSLIEVLDAVQGRRHCSTC